MVVNVFKPLIQDVFCTQHLGRRVLGCKHISNHDRWRHFEILIRTTRYLVYVWFTGLRLFPVIIQVCCVPETSIIKEMYSKVFILDAMLPFFFSPSTVRCWLVKSTSQIETMWHHFEKETGVIVCARLYGMAAQGILGLYI